MDGRKEKRLSRTLRVLLSSGGQPVVAEYASTENVSSSGARVRTDRPWRPDSRVVIKSSQGDLWARARVVYCQTVQSKTLQSRMFVLGLEFLARTGDWMLRAFSAGALFCVYAISSALSYPLPNQTY